MLQVYRLCINILMTAYAAAILVGASSTNLYQKIAIVSDDIFLSKTQIHIHFFFISHFINLKKLIQVTGHGLLASTLWQRAQQFDIANKECITPFYMFIWKVCKSLCFVISVSLLSIFKERKDLLMCLCLLIYFFFFIILQLFYAEYFLIPFV